MPIPSAAALWTYETSVSPDSRAMRRSVMFSPIVAIAAVTTSSTRCPSISAAFSASSEATPKAARAIAPTIAWKFSLRETKSVSELTSTTTPVPPATATATSPSAAVRPCFLAALASPLVRSQSTAASMSPLVSVSAFLASIIPAPVASRSSFTMLAVIDMLLSTSGYGSPGRAGSGSAPPSPAPAR